MKMIPPMSESPYLASVEITRRCDNLCPYCHQQKADRDMSVSRFSEWLEQLAKEGFKAVAVGGGEPTLHPELGKILKSACDRGFITGLTTNARDTHAIIRLADDGLLQSFGVSAGKGMWQKLAAHPRAIVNMLLLKKGSAQLKALASEAIRLGAKRLLLLGYKGTVSDFRPETEELSDALTALTHLGREFGVAVAADDYTRRRLGLTDTCGKGFIRIDIDGKRDSCCFTDCEYRQ